MEEVTEKSRVVHLQSSTGEKVEVPYKAALLSGLVKEALEETNEDDDDEEELVVELLKFSTLCLRTVADFVIHYAQEPMNPIAMPLVGRSLEEIITQSWYKDFITNQERAMIFELISVANFMAIDPLLNICCLWTTFDLQGKSAEEIAEILKIPKMTAEEEAKAREDHPWIFDD